MLKTLFLSVAFCGLLLGSAAFAATDADEMMATFLNLKSKLCAKVVKVNKLEQPDTDEVHSIEYRGGDGTVDYIVNVKSG